MNSTEDTGRTPDQAAYEAFYQAARMNPPGYDVLERWQRARWEAAAQAAINARVNTDEDTAAELAAAHELLAAIASAAVVPLPASEGNPDHMQAYYQARSRRLNYIELTAAVQPGGSALLIRSNAESLTRLAAEPLPYQAEGEPS